MNLEIDMGNTRFKWRLKDGEKIIASGSDDNKNIFDHASFNHVFATIEKYQPSKVGVASVSGACKELLNTWCQHKWHIEPQYLTVSEEDLGVINGYIIAEQMGVDRWLAMLAAYSVIGHQACLVVDSGSACTIDMILADGRHLGGYIVPGVQLMRKALFRDTDRVKLDEVSYDSAMSPGKTTQQAVSSGLWMMQLGLVNLSLERLLSEGAVKPYVLFTGGNGEQLLNLFNGERLAGSQNRLVSKVEFNSDLVLDGISLLIERC
jgi:type III pantothenate kinase